MDATITEETTGNLADLYELFGIAATFTPAAGDAVSCTVLPDTSKSSVELYLQADARVSIISVRKSEVAAVHLTGDKITIGADIWRVERIVFEDDFEWQLLLSKDI